MTEREAIYKMEQLIVKSQDDAEMGHADADALLCEFLSELGHRTLVEKYAEVKKWYS